MSSSILTNIISYSLNGMWGLLKYIPSSLVVAFGQAMGRLLAFGYPKQQRIALAQLRYVRRTLQKSPETGVKDKSSLQASFSDKDLKKLFFKTFASSGRAVAEALIIDKIFTPIEIPAGSIRPHFKYIKTHGDEFVDEFIKNKQPTLAISAHTGCFEIIAAYYAKLGIPLSIIGRDANSAVLDKMLKEFRANYNTEQIWRSDAHAGTKLISAIRRNHTIAVLLDQDTNLKNTFVPFFGMPAAHPEAPVKIAVKFRMPIWTTFIVREKGLYQRIISEQIIYDPSSPHVIEEILTEYEKRLEKLLLQYPEQWPWWHRRWRRRPGVPYNGIDIWPPRTEEYISWLDSLS